MFDSFTLDLLGATSFSVLIANYVYSVMASLKILMGQWEFINPFPSIAFFSVNYFRILLDQVRTFPYLVIIDVLKLIS